MVYLHHGVGDRDAACAGEWGSDRTPSTALWIIEGRDQEKGGEVQFNRPYRLRWRPLVCPRRPAPFLDWKKGKRGIRLSRGPWSDGLGSGCPGCSDVGGAHVLCRHTSTAVLMPIGSFAGTWPPTCISELRRRGWSTPSCCGPVCARISSVPEKSGPAKKDLKPPGFHFLHAHGAGKTSAWLDVPHELHTTGCGWRLHPDTTHHNSLKFCQ